MRALAIALAFAVATSVACGSKPASPPAPPGPPAPAGELADSCTTTDDCELVEACCGCTAGGKKIAIRKDAVAGYTASREQRCGDVMCPQVISTDPSCDSEAVCGSGNRCRRAPHMQHQ
jgi:hypothetical protein